MGKNGKLGKDYGRVVGKDSKSRPGWRGPGFTKKADVSKAKPTSGEIRTPGLDKLIPVELQQLLLNIFRDAFPAVLASDTLPAVLQDVKTALYDRDFTRAFGRSEYLEAYSIRWSPARALCYHSILIEAQKYLAKILLVTSNMQSTISNSDPSNADTPETILRVACFGGGAAEVIAFGGYLRYLGDSLHPEGITNNSTIEGLTNLSISAMVPKVDLLVIDVAKWQDVVQTLHRGVVDPPPLSKYASSSVKEANKSLISKENLATTFHSEDLLAMSLRELADLLGNKPMLVTLLFTLNELYTTSIGRTTAFLLNLTASLKPGSVLLVVDSPGSYSETTVGTEAKKYPMQWLIDHTLLETDKSRGQESAVAWVKEISEDAKWFRIPENLRYTIPLENMRYQVHLYRRV